MPSAARSLRLMHATDESNIVVILPKFNFLSILESVTVA